MQAGRPTARKLRWASKTSKLQGRQQAKTLKQEFVTLVTTTMRTIIIGCFTSYAVILHELFTFITLISVHLNIDYAVIISPNIVMSIFISTLVASSLDKSCCYVLNYYIMHPIDISYLKTKTYHYANYMGSLHRSFPCI